MLFSHVGLILCVGLLSVCHLVCDVRQSDDALPIGLPQSDYLAHHSIMFTSRSNAMHHHSRVSVLMRAGLTALPQIIQPRCDSLRSMCCYVQPSQDGLYILLLAVLLRCLIL